MCTGKGIARKEGRHSRGGGHSSRGAYCQYGYSQYKERTEGEQKDKSRLSLDCGEHYGLLKWWCIVMKSVEGHKVV